jgi:transposase
MVAAIGAVIKAKEFKNDRHLSAWLGLVERQYSCGGKSLLQGISKPSDNTRERY